ncbi:arginine N-succinyltransferase [Marinobacter bohaiensis]|uniref:arginine N-succinyltransferase n=1 Tax=Marinobacter bohaiensis TaxID=2201898 RepID=UPI000DABA8A6|nr:arginine N-succinyltransferase [Marinobacter bohaiensis]
MLLIRPVNQGDLEDLLEMAHGAGKGLTSLPPNRDLLASKIARAEETFNERCEPEAGMYLFALEDTEQKKCVGISGIEARVGLDEVWYNYRLSTTVNASRELGVHVRTPTLHLTNDMTDTSEICSLLLSDTHRQGGNGLLLSRSRFLYMADFRELFSDKVFAEMRGVSDADGRSPLWDALGRRFFDMDFSEADFLSGMGNKSFIAELMPKYPIYVPLLPPAAREVLSEVHDNTKPALRMLQAEGFNFNGLVDIFDGGPVVEAFIHNVRAVRESMKRHVLVTRQPVNLDVPPEERAMVSNRSFRDFRVTTLPLSCIKPDTVSMPAEVADALQVTSGDLVRLSPLKDGNRTRAAQNH